MKLLNTLFQFYVNASIHVAFAVVALIGVTALEYDLNIPSYTCGFVFFGTINAYNFVKYAKVAGLHHRSLTNSLKSIQVFSVICFGMMLYFGVQLPQQTMLVLAFFGVLTFFYAVPLLKRKNLRTFGRLKIYIVAIVWAGVTVFVPMVSAKMELTLDCWITLVQRILIVIVLTLPFEIRDLPFDASELKTLPQQLGIRKVKILGLLMLVIAILIEGFKDELSIPHLISLLLICQLMGVFLLLSEKKQTNYFASFWVEGSPIVWLGLLILLRNFPF